MKKLFGVILTAAGSAAFFLFFYPHTVTFQGNTQVAGQQEAASLPQVPEASIISSFPDASSSGGVKDIANQQQLKNPPEITKAVYVTGWSAGSYNKMTSIINLIEERGLNAIVIDVKDYSGYVSYAMDVTEAKTSGAENEIRIAKPNELIKRLHDKNIYVIGRITVFQDPIIAKAHPEWAMQNKLTGKTWTDNHRLAWLDPAGKPAWDYVVSLAKDALSRGFDEINFDYVRFASDGDLNAIDYPFWDKKTPRHLVIKKFFSYLREQLPDAKLSADLFGLSTVNHDDLGIGQVIEDAYQYFDYVCPMVYPSHYASGFLGYKNPALYPYEVIKYSMDNALNRLLGKSGVAAGTSTVQTAAAQNSSATIQTAVATDYRAKLRPWLQVFDLGAVYTSEMISDEIRAANDALASSSKEFGGWLLWDPANNYKNFK